jgi:hypothetical protein
MPSPLSRVHPITPTATVSLSSEPQTTVDLHTSQDRHPSSAEEAYPTEEKTQEPSKNKLQYTSSEESSTFQITSSTTSTSPPLMLRIGSMPTEPIISQPYTHINEKIKDMESDSLSVQDGRMRHEIAECCRGCIFWKIPRSLFSQPRKVKIRLIPLQNATEFDPDNESTIDLNAKYAICWERKKHEKQECILLKSPSGVCSLYQGQEKGCFVKPAMRKKMNKLGLQRVTQRSLSFSLINNDRSLDLISTHTNDYERWVTVLNYLLRRIPTPSGK